jgi:putative transposase
VTGDAISAEVMRLQTWPLCCRYAVVLFDALRIDVREAGVVRSKSLYLSLGVHAESGPEVLGVWLQQDRGAAFWLEVCEQLRDRGVERIRVLMADGLEGLSEAAEAAFPASAQQFSPVPLIRHSLREAARRDRKLLAAALRPIYAAGSAGRAQAKLDALACGGWGAKYPSTVERWQAARQPLLPLFALPRDLRRLAVLGFDAIEDLHRGLSRRVERHGCFADDAAATEFAWLAQREVSRRWTPRAKVGAFVRPAHGLRGSSGLPLLA